MPATKKPASSSSNADGLRIFEGLLTRRGLSNKAAKSTTAALAQTLNGAKGAGTISGLAGGSSGSHANGDGHTGVAGKLIPAATNKSGGRKRFSFANFTTKIRLRILQHLPTERDVLTFLQVEGACRDVLYVYPESVFARYRHIDDFPWISSFPRQRSQLIRQSWHSSSSRWAVVLLEDAAAAATTPRNSITSSASSAHKPRHSRYDALLLDFHTEALVSSRIIHPIPRHLASSSDDKLPDWSEIILASFTRNEKYAVTSSRNLTCVCECAKKAIIAIKEHPPRRTFGRIERSVLTEDARFLILVGTRQVQVCLASKPTECVLSIKRPEAKGGVMRRCTYNPTTELLVIVHMGYSVEWWDLSRRRKQPYLSYRFTGPSIDPEYMNEPPEDPSGRKLLMTKLDGTGNAVLQDLRHVEVEGRRMLQKPHPLIHSDIGGYKRWSFTADGRWLLLITSCCEHLVRMWDLTADFAEAKEVPPSEVNPEKLFKVPSGGLQFRGTVGTFLICANFAANSRDMADAILIFNTKTKEMKVVSTAGSHLHKTCPGVSTVSPEGNCLVTTCEKRDEVRTWLVPDKVDMIPPQIQLQNHRTQPMPKEALDENGRDLVKEAKRMQASTIRPEISSGEYFVVTNRNNILVPATRSTFFTKSFKENVRDLRARNRDAVFKVTQRTMDRLWEMYRVALVKKNYSKVDLLLTAGGETAACLAHLPRALFRTMWQVASIETLLRNPDYFHRCYSMSAAPAPGMAVSRVSGKKPSTFCGTVSTSSSAAASAAAMVAHPSGCGNLNEGVCSTSSAKAPAHHCHDTFTMLDKAPAAAEALWLHRPSLHLLGRSEVVELMLDDFAGSEKRDVFFSQDGYWVLGGPRIYNLKEVEGYLQEKASFETDTINAVGCLNELMDRLSCSCKSCTKIANSLAALVAP
ncbi:hypothetical protein K437DRAFT_254939 [Tilletiaria anomala UBC 951]|uniref:Uncharacterized protein n=1 Tax=Tilletiaria anomala (strain ATCC 24038 / CBS 436.72 / UBC 951) TaxID=1037660 RepID=A0A066WBR2_TILAU|nr:uncharacterized protein K437DRAFT_254939 [Tilletiaria anomala UBC 951]KDN51347.1 hypothetical protein K437DRAFT_254939 [Tilletiaria anomala UBC 951]